MKSRLLAAILLLVGCAGKKQPGDAATPPAGSDAAAIDGVAVAIDALTPLVDLAPADAPPVAIDAAAPLDAVAGPDVAADSPIAEASAPADAPAAPDGDVAAPPAADADAAGEVSGPAPLDLYTSCSTSPDRRSRRTMA